MSCGLSPDAWMMAAPFPSGEHRLVPGLQIIDAGAGVLVVPGPCKSELVTVRAVLDGFAVASLVSYYLLDRSLVRIKLENGICAGALAFSGEDEGPSVGGPFRVPVSYFVGVCDVTNREFCQVEKIEVRLLVSLKILRVEEEPTVRRRLLKKGSLVAQRQ